MVILCFFCYFWLSVDTTNLSKTLDFFAKFIVIEIKDLLLIFRRFLFITPLDPDLAGIKANIFILSRLITKYISYIKINKKKNFFLLLL